MVIIKELNFVLLENLCSSYVLDIEKVGHESGEGGESVG